MGILYCFLRNWEASESPLWPNTLNKVFVSAPSLLLLPCISNPLADLKSSINSRVYNQLQVYKTVIWWFKIAESVEEASMWAWIYGFIYLSVQYLWTLEYIEMEFLQSAKRLKSMYTGYKWFHYKCPTSHLPALSFSIEKKAQFS